MVDNDNNEDDDAFGSGELKISQFSSENYHLTAMKNCSILHWHVNVII